VEKFFTHAAKASVEVKVEEEQVLRCCCAAVDPKGQVKVEERDVRGWRLEGES